MRLIRQSLNALENRLDLLRGNLLPMLLHRHTLIVEEESEDSPPFRIRSLVGTVYKRHIVSAALFCHSLICHQHEILNDPGGHIRLVRLDVNGSSRCIEDDLALREIKINGTSVVTVSPAGSGKAPSSGKTWAQDLHTRFFASSSVSSRMFFTSV